MYVTRVVIKYRAVIPQVTENLADCSPLAVNTRHQQEDINDSDNATCSRMYENSPACVNSLKTESCAKMYSDTAHTVKTLLLEYFAYVINLCVLYYRQKYRG
jgi:hypothetical protein